MAICGVRALRLNIQADSACAAAVSDCPCAFQHCPARREEGFAGNVEPRGGTAL